MKGTVNVFGHYSTPILKRTYSHPYISYPNFFSFRFPAYEEKWEGVNIDVKPYSCPGSFYSEGYNFRTKDSYTLRVFKTAQPYQIRSMREFFVENILSTVYITPTGEASQAAWNNVAEFGLVIPRIWNENAKIASLQEGLLAKFDEFVNEKLNIYLEERKLLHSFYRKRLFTQKWLKKKYGNGAKFITESGNELVGEFDFNGPSLILDCANKGIIVLHNKLHRLRQV